MVAEIKGDGSWQRGFVYVGGQMVAVQQNNVAGITAQTTHWVFQDPVTKSQRLTNSVGTVVSTVDLDPFGGETARSSSSAFQPHRYTTYERDANGTDDAMHRRFDATASRFSQPDPYHGSYRLTNPQSFNRYAYVQNDPVNFVDPSGLMPQLCLDIYTGDGSKEVCFGNYVPFDPYNPKDPPIPDGPDTPPDPKEPDVCGIMANAAQSLARASLDFWKNPKDALGQFDILFSQRYLGNNGIGKTLASARAFFSTDVQPRTTALGEGGFRPEFKEGDPLSGDQTHHFAGFLTAGINGQYSAAALHKWGTDFNNKPDRLLGDAAYKIGADLSKDPRGLFTIGERILKDICDG